MMTRTCKAFGLATLLLAGAAQLGCRACGSPYDYAPPVVGCDCHTCDQGGRRGSAISEHYADAENLSADDAEIEFAARPEPDTIRQ